MITKDKFALNLKELKNRIPDKPLIYTKEYPRTIRESLNYYCNKRTVHSIQSCVHTLNIEDWPLPLWFDPENIKLGFGNYHLYKKLYYSDKTGKKIKRLNDFDFIRILPMISICFKRTFDEIIIEAFDANLKYVFKKMQESTILGTKAKFIISLKDSYKKSNWTACVITIFPLIDFVVRRILNTNNLGIDVSKICKLFEQNGFSLKNVGDLMPHQTFVSSHQTGQPFLNKERVEWFGKMLDFDLGLLGPALCSFIYFANHYYSFYKEDQESGGEVELLNRHAILHGSISQFGSKGNTVKLITFLYLILELDIAFEILFSE